MVLTRRGGDRTLVRLANTFSNQCHDLTLRVRTRLWRGVLYTTSFDKFVSEFAAGRGFLRCSLLKIPFYMAEKYKIENRVNSYNNNGQYRKTLCTHKSPAFVIRRLFLYNLEVVFGLFEIAR
jgi:hypothetical protein